MKTLVVVDVQPAYEGIICFDVCKLVERMREYERVIIYFNGEEMSCQNLSEVAEFFFNHGMTHEEIDTVQWCEKSYGFLRGWMDTGVPHEDIVEVLGRMVEEGYTDSREFHEEYLHSQGLPIDDCIGFPCFEGDPENVVVDSIVTASTVDICGGGRNECLCEMELYFQGLGVDTERVNTFVY